MSFEKQHKNFIEPLISTMADTDCSKACTGNPSNYDTKKKEKKTAAGRPLHKTCTCD